MTAPPRYATDTERSVPLAPLALLLSVLVAPVGVLLGVIALRRIRRDDEPGKHTAVAAIAVGTLVTVAYVALAITLIVLFVQLQQLQDPVPPSLTRTAP